MKKTARLLILVVFLILVTALTSCGGGGLSERQAIDVFLVGNKDAENVTVNGMTKCELSDTSKVQYNIDNAWLVNLDFYSPMLEKDQNIAIAIGEKDGNYTVVAQGSCPW